MATILLGITGSIAAYKAADITSRLVKASHDVHVLMTPAATKFIAPLTLQTLSRHPVVTSVFDEQEGWCPNHIELADRANLLLVAPATADSIARLSLGLADDVISTLALVLRAPILIAPAMNGKMWEHPVTQEHVARLRERGVHFIGPESGMLACGYEGAGRLWDVEKIVERALELIG